MADYELVEDWEVYSDPDDKDPDDLEKYPLFWGSDRQKCKDGYFTPVRKLVRFMA